MVGVDRNFTIETHGDLGIPHDLRTPRCSCETLALCQCLAAPNVRRPRAGPTPKGHRGGEVGCPE